MSHELAEFNRRSFYSSRPSLSDVVKIKSSSYLREGTIRSLLLMILRSRHTHCLEAYQGAPSEGQLSPLRLTKKTKRCTLDKLVVDKQAFFFYLDALQIELRLDVEPPQRGENSALKIIVYATGQYNYTRLRVDGSTSRILHHHTPHGHVHTGKCLCGWDARGAESPIARACKACYIEGGIFNCAP